MSREQLLIIGLIVVQLLLEADLEAGLEEVGLHHFRRLLYIQCVFVGPGCLHLHLRHVFLGGDSLVVEGLELRSILIYKGSWSLLLEHLESLVLSDWLQRSMISMHLRLSN